MCPSRPTGTGRVTPRGDPLPSATIEVTTRGRRTQGAKRPSTRLHRARPLSRPPGRTKTRRQGAVQINLKLTAARAPCRRVFVSARQWRCAPKTKSRAPPPTWRTGSSLCADHPPTIRAPRPPGQAPTHMPEGAGFCAVVQPSRPIPTNSRPFTLKDATRAVSLHEFTENRQAVMGSRPRTLTQSPVSTVTHLTVK